MEDSTHTHTQEKLGSIIIFEYKHYTFHVMYETREEKMRKGVRDRERETFLSYLIVDREYLKE